MPTTKADFTHELSRLHAHDLRRALDLAEREAPDDAGVEALAEMLADAVWWSYCTPLGYLAERATLEGMVDDLARRLGHADLVGDDGMGRLRALTGRVTRQRLEGLDGLDSETRARLRRSMAPSILLSGSGVGAAGAARVGHAVLRFGKTPLGRLLPQIPMLARWWAPIRGVAGAAAAVGTPLAVVLALLALNQVFGTNVPRFALLLLVIGQLPRRTLAFEPAPA